MTSVIFMFSMLELGKLGKCRMDDLLGKPLGLLYEMYDRDRTRIAPKEAIFDDYGGWIAPIGAT